MKNGLALATILLFSVLLPGIAKAGQPATAQQFAAVLENPGHHQQVLQSAEQTPAWKHVACAAASFAPAPEIGVYMPILFDQNGAPVTGEWREGIVASGCGAPITLNVLTQITAPSTLATGFLLPGSTIADPVLQNAAQGFAVKAAGGQPAGCKAGFIANTAFAGYDGLAQPQAGKQSGPWKEVWTLDLCGPPKQVVMHFAADAASVTINAVPVAPAQ